MSLHYVLQNILVTNTYQRGVTVMHPLDYMNSDRFVFYGDVGHQDAIFENSILYSLSLYMTSNTTRHLDKKTSMLNYFFLIKLN